MAQQNKWKRRSTTTVSLGKNEHHFPVGAILQFEHTLQLLSSSFIDEIFLLYWFVRRHITIPSFYSCAEERDNSEKERNFIYLAF